MNDRLGLVAVVLLCALAIALTLFLTVYTDQADAKWPTLYGKASVYGNDPAIGFVDYQDNCTTASGVSCTVGGIAVNNHRIGWRASFARYGGGWWWVCPPRRFHLRCKLLKQNEAGPSTHRTGDISAVGLRHAWGIFASRFPTDVGTWKFKYRGKRRR